MKLLKRILVAVEVDDASRHVVTEAGTLARKFGSEVVLAHAVEPLEFEAGQSPEVAVAGWLGQFRDELAGAGVTVGKPLCLSGKPYREIVRAAERLDANVIVLGARGVAASQQVALGTTAEQVMRNSLKPVLAVVPDQPLDMTNIICPVDFSDASGRGLTNAIQLARAFQSRLEVITVMFPPTPYHRIDARWTAWQVASEAAAVRQSTREFDDFLNRFDFREVTWAKRIQRGDPATEVLAAATNARAGLLVMGSTGRTGLAHILLGSTALKVARKLPCALLTVKREGMLVAQLERDIADINAAFQEGQELLAQGFCREAITRFDQCLALHPFFVQALDSKIAAHERAGDTHEAEQCRRQAELIREQLWIRDSM